jgi:hypothetical protein
MTVHVAEHRMPQGQFAELRRERDVLLVREKLLAKEDDAPLQKRRANLRDLARIQLLRKIDTMNLRADMRGKRRDLNRLYVLHCGCTHEKLLMS